VRRPGESEIYNVVKNLERFKVSIAHDLLTAMRVIDQGAIEIALVMDKNDRLVGTLTDGDVRRALLRGERLDSPLAPHFQKSFTAVDPGTSRAEVIELMQARTLGQIPVVDAQGRLVGLHLLHELIGCIERPNWAVIMAGGKGTRLRPVTEHIPKPLIRVAGRPILERLVLHLVGYGIRHIFLSINYLGHMIRDCFGRGERFGCRIDYLEETIPLGTGGALGLLRELPPEPLLVLNGDLVTQADIGAMLEFHEVGGYRLTLAVREYYHTVPYGCVDVVENQIVRIEEKPLVNRLVNAGIYVLEPDIVTRVPKDQEFPITSLVEQAVSLQERVGAFRIQDDWIDVGHKEQLKMARNGSA
jgi:dTDP-glucose pyrophosphorylase/CBS domain-containing protein